MSETVPASGDLAARVVPDRDAAEIAEILSRGALEPEGRLVEASNTTLRCQVTLDGVSVRCVYKPVAGERPLWDFPDGTLAGREVAAYLVSAAAGWELVPPTVHRDGPFGPGACQLWIDEAADPPVGFVPEHELPAGWHRIAAARDEHGGSYVLAHADDPRLARMAIFDVVVNNADRKASHVLVSSAGSAGGAGRASGALYGVDHGVCFHVEPKLRTVLWGWAGQPLPEAAAAGLARLDEALGRGAGTVREAVSGHLSRDEVAALAGRVRALRRTGRFPEPNRHWPAVPWPPV